MSSRTLAALAALAFPLAACAGAPSTTTVVQNGLIVQTALRHDPAHTGRRLVAVTVRDADSRLPVTDAEVGVGAGGHFSAAANQADGMYLASLDGENARARLLNIAVLAHGKNVLIQLRRP